MGDARGQRSKPRQVTGLHVALAAGVALAYSLWLFLAGPYVPMEAHGGIVDERIGIDAAGVQAHLDAMGPAGRADYLDFLAADVLFPLLQAAWIAGFLWIGASRWKRLPRWSVAVPAGMVLFDWLENLFLAILVGQHPSMSQAVAQLAVVALHLKFAFNATSLLAVLALIGWHVAHPVRRRR